MGQAVTHLGRAWRGRPYMVYTYTNMTKVVSPAGWSDDNHPECNKGGGTEAKVPPICSRGRSCRSLLHKPLLLASIQYVCKAYVAHASVY
ncbi:hypothetical protein DVH24_005407 [Malus domestica]|uniref:Pectinesterase n=1 Tax=Malus domestica TaxID=3750 RepID=A0A498KMI8_MALDO|nr:hypothetical protein DVH24_005407 [Malus domestica]